MLPLALPSAQVRQRLALYSRMPALQCLAPHIIFMEYSRTMWERTMERRMHYSSVEEPKIGSFPPFRNGPLGKQILFYVGLLTYAET